MKIVIPVDLDKQTIVKRTGQAPYFAIYEDEKFIQVIENAHGHSNTHDSHGHKEDKEHVSGHKKDVQILVGNDVILVQMLGEHMREALESIDLKIKKIRQKDGSTAQEAVKNFLENKI